MIKRTFVLGTLLFIFAMFFAGFASGQWYDGLNNDLVNYWNGSVAEGVYSGNDLVTNLGTPTYQVLNCKVGDCIDFDSGDVLNVSNTISNVNFNPNATRGWSMNFWMRTESTNEQYPIIKGYFAGEYWSIQARMHNDDKIKFYSNGGSTPQATAPAITTSNYYMVTVVQNTTDICSWINASVEGTCVSITSWGINPNMMMLSNDRGVDYIGQLDEIGVWNRTLNYTEIQALWNNGDATTWGGGSAPPFINITNPNPITTFAGLIPEVYYPFDLNLAFAENVTNYGFYNFTLDHNPSSCNCYTEFTKGKLLDGAYNNDSQHRYFDVDSSYEDYFDFHNDSWTWAFWFNTSNTTSNQNILDKFGDGSDPDRWYLDYNPQTNQLRFTLRNATAVTTNLNADVSLDDSIFHRIVITYDNSTQNASVYVDNVFNKTLHIGVMDSNNSNDFRVGRVGAGFWKNAMIDDLQFYRVAWNTSIISQDWNNGDGINWVLYGKMLEINQTYNTEALEGGTESFGISAYYGANFDTVSAKFYYNNTEYDFDSITYPETEIVNFGVNDVIIPDVVSSGTLKEFYWVLNGTYSNGTSLLFTSTAYNQTVNSVSIDNCSAYSELLMNISLYDEDSLTFLDGNASNTSISLQININDVLSYNNTFTKTNPAQVCIDSLNNTVQLDAEIRYMAEDKVAEYYYIQNQTTSNTTIPVNIQLYDLEILSSQEFLITYKDESFIPVPNVLIEIQRQYLSEGLFRVVERPKTDQSGQTIAHLVLSDEVYNIIVKENGTVLATYNDVNAVCQDTSSGQCTINLNEFQSGTQPTDWFTYNGVTYSLTFNEGTSTFSFNFENLDGSQHYMELNVTDLGATATLDCSNSVTATSGTLNCISSASNTTLLAKAFKDGSFVGEIFVTVQDNDDRQGFDRNTGIILVMILYITLPLMAITDRVLMVIAGIVGMVLGGVLALYTSGSIIGGGSVVLWFIVAGVIVIYKVTRRRV